jgi:SAM-dependent methyltransferase
MKKLPLHRRPYFSRRVLEVGGGHAPYAGVTHAVDKFPHDDSQRAGAIAHPLGVTLVEGELEALPFESEPKFDFIYVSHVLEHVHSPTKAMSEISRVAKAGYLETPSPLGEHVWCAYPHEPEKDFHLWFCWTVSSQPNVMHFLRKSDQTLGVFCECEDGKLASRLFQLHHSRKVNTQVILPRNAKTTRLFFKGPVNAIEHTSFAEACAAGSCAFGTAESVRRWTSFFGRAIFSRFRELREHLARV